MISQQDVREYNALVRRALRGGFEFNIGDLQLRSGLSLHYTLEDRGHDTFFHSHPHYELSVLFTGGMCYTGEKEEVVLEGGRGEWVLIAPELTHRRRTTEDDSLLLGFAFYIEGVDGAALPHPLIRRLKGRILKLNGKELLPLLTRIEALLCSGERFRVERLRLLISELLLELFTAGFPSLLREREDSCTLSDTLELADRYIEANLAGEITADGIARHVGISRRHLYRLFTAKHGVPLKEYIIRRRLNRAAAALTGSNRTVKEIAEMTGFHNLSYFSRQFRRLYSIPPAAYRKKSS